MDQTRRGFLKTAALAAAGVSSAGARSLSSALSRRSSAQKRVLIIGAGLAGLSAAYELRKTGHQVTILEARTRAGGRVYTLREPFSDGLYAEAGATWIPQTHSFTLGYIRKFGLELEHFWVDGLDTINYIRGRRYKVLNGTPLEPFKLTGEEAALGADGLRRKYLAGTRQALGVPSAPDWKIESYRQYDDVSYADFLRKRGASEEAIALISLGMLWGDGPETVSALTVFRDNAHIEFPGFKVKGGNDLLPKAFAAQLNDCIHYGSPVVRIEHSNQSVRVTFMQSGSQNVLTADRLVCAIPFSVLRRIEIEPRFSAGKQKAIETLPYFSASRVYLQSRKKFWIEQGLDGFASTDLPITDVWDMTSNHPGPRGILHCYAGGPNARNLASMNESDRIRFVLDQMEKVYPGIKENFEGGASKCWDEDEWARGASSWYRPGQMSELWPHIARAEGRVHFAGDHTSAFIRWQNGALQSGNRVAAEINAAD
ncbi:MAG TPA: flavin monoamine oxidase family protein [Blastocatellia bacterium]|nr:flavin monoamine oxidase family protein [Blastocatellia bacterium]